MKKRLRKKRARNGPFNGATQRRYRRRFPGRVVSRYPFHHWLDYYARHRAALDSEAEERASIFELSDVYETNMLNAEKGLKKALRQRRDPAARRSARG